MGEKLKICRKKDCDELRRPGNHQWYCETHYAEIHRLRECKKDDCDQDVLSSGLYCEQHKNANCKPGCTCALHPCEPGCQCGKHKRVLTILNDPTYVARHNMVRKLRGRAALYACDHCGSQAHDWATIHGCDGTDLVNHYISLCVRCHRLYDDTAAAVRGKPMRENARKALEKAQKSRSHESFVAAGKKSAETRKTSGTPFMTQEHKDRIGASLEGVPKSSKARENMRKSQLRRYGKMIGPDGEPMLISEYEAETGQPCGIS
jgi:hypothetical protein